MSPVTNFSASLWVRALQETRISQDVAVYSLLLQSLFLRSGFHCFFFSLLILGEFLRSFQRMACRESMFSSPPEFPLPSGTVAHQLQSYSSGN